MARSGQKSLAQEFQTPGTDHPERGVLQGGGSNLLMILDAAANLGSGPPIHSTRETTLSERLNNSWTFVRLLASDSLIELGLTSLSSSACPSPITETRQSLAIFSISSGLRNSPLSDFAGLHLDQVTLFGENQSVFEIR